MHNFLYKWCLKHYSKDVYGAILIALAGILSSITSATTHSFGIKLPTMQILFFKCLNGLLLLLFIYKKNFFLFFKTKILKFHFYKGFCGALGNFFLIYSLQKINLAQVSILSLSSAFFTSLGGIIFFKEKFLFRTWLCIVFGLLGVVLITNPFKSGINYLAFFPIFSAFCFSLSSLFVKEIAKNDKWQTTLIYLLIFMAIFSGATSIITPFVIVNFIHFYKLIVIGLSYTFTQFCLIEAYANANTSFIAPFKYVRFPLNVLIGIIFFQEFLGINAIIGASLIFISYFYLIYSAKKTTNT